MPLRGREGRLRGCRAHALERMTERDPEAAGEVRGLIEPAFACSRSVKGNRNRALRAGEDVGASAAHQRGERRRQRSPAVVFQRVDDFPQRALIFAGRGPRRDRAAGTVAAIRADRKNGLPAPGADRAVERMFERASAGRAGRRETDCKKRVEGATRPAD